MLEIFSGECSMGICGTPVGHKDYFGVEIHTGDIVTHWHGEYLGTDIEHWSGGDSLTAVVTGDDGIPFVMGLKSCGFDSPEWQIRIIKKFHDAIAGEHWKNFGFSYKETKGTPC